MKIVIILSILATICCFEVCDAALNAGTAAITRLKSTTKSTKDDLKRYGNKLAFELSTKLSNLKIDQMQNINNIVNPAMDDVRSTIAAAKANGKDADRCFEPARLKLRDASQNGFKQLDECAETGKSTIKPVQSNIDAAVLNGDIIISELDSIAINCYSANAMQMQNCIIGQIPNASAKVQLYQNTANELKRTGDSLSSSAVTTAFSCNLNVPQNVREVATSVRIETKQCADNS